MKNVIFIFLINFSLIPLSSQNSDTLIKDTVSEDQYPHPSVKPPGYYGIQDPARFKGGEVAFNKFLDTNLIYPKRCLDAGISDTVWIKFVVSVDGTLSRFNVLNSIVDCPEFTEEVLRVMKLSPRWIPAQYNGRFVISWCELPIALRF